MTAPPITPSQLNALADKLTTTEGMNGPVINCYHPLEGPLRSAAQQLEQAQARIAELTAALQREQDGCARILTGSFGASDDWLRHFERMHQRIELALAPPAQPAKG